MNNRRTVILVLALIAAVVGFLFAYKDDPIPENHAPMLADQPPAPQTQKEAYATDGCIVTGCNSEICKSESSGGMAEDDTADVSICKSDPMFDCYKQHGVCRRLYGDECGWDPTSQLKACFEEKMKQSLDHTPLDQLVLPDGATVPLDVTPDESAPQTTTPEPKE